ncbi:MAG: sigma-70 family RNA polymerase sigma factor [Erysipelotrichaceae bacterium]|nr:sigma-70 family RNA polymerase sigma factor [Erysipelotrichaceae bacterium]MDD3924499.1 sigma-70 family RNA polymerase sigma factor [Erysipelotrichaceae bacterium]MDD4643002.1 sigma-70 family RNA polymerase sigma factor [Erysipelotrichaceae bacterium]
MRVDGIKRQFEDVVNIYYPMLYRFVYVKLASEHSVDDVCQEVFCTLYCKDHDFDSEFHLKCWLFKAALLRCRKFWRSSWYNNVVCIDNIDIYESYDKRTSEVEYAVSELPSRYRTLIHLYYFEGLSIKEISSIVEQNESTISSALHRARGMLKKRLKEDYDFE